MNPNYDSVVSGKRPYGVHWLDSCYQETLLPNGPWQDKVYPILCDSVAEKLAQQLQYPERKQMIFEMMGLEFVLKYFSDENYDPDILLPPKMSADERRKLEIDAQNWLRNVVNKSASETGCQGQMVALANGETLSVEMIDFIEHAQQIIKQGLDRHLYIKEQGLIKKWERLQQKNVRMKTDELEAREMERIRREHDRLKSVIARNQNPGRPMEEQDLRRLDVSSRMSSKSITNNVKGALFGSKEDPPLFWGIQSNAIGKSLLAVLRRDPRQLTQVTSALHGRQLPGSLRSYIWLDILLKYDRERYNTHNAEALVRERFAKAVTRGISELKIKHPTSSPINKVIDKAVTEIYDKTPSMWLYVKDRIHMKEVSKTMNVLYVYDRNYEPYLIYWLFPMQLAFGDGSKDSEHSYELAMYLNLLQNLFPKAAEIFAIAERAMSRLESADPSFYEHLKTIAQINPTINPKEFLVHLIHAEKLKADEILNASPSKTSNTASYKLLADPLIFLRKWIGDGFVSILDTQAAIFVWDQLFMQFWNSSVMEDFCLALLFLLKDKFMGTNDYSDMKQVFLQDPSKLYTVDIQKAWIHVQKRRDLNEIPAMNCLVHSQSIQASPAPSASPSDAHSSKQLGASTIQASEVHLVFPREILEQEPTLSRIDPVNMKLSCTIYFGTVQLQTRQSASPPELKSVTVDSRGNQICIFSFERDKFDFAELDSSEYDLEQEMGGYPYAVFGLDYVIEHSISGRVSSRQPRSTINLAWARLRLYQTRTDALDNQEPPGKKWDLKVGKHVCRLYPGKSLDEGCRTTPDSSRFVDGVVSNESKIIITVTSIDNIMTPKSQLANSTARSSGLKSKRL